LVKFELFAGIPNNSAKIGRGPDEHGHFPKSQRSLTLPNVSDR
jgi:hypothetical protein